MVHAKLIFLNGDLEQLGFNLLTKNTSFFEAKITVPSVPTVRLQWDQMYLIGPPGNIKQKVVTADVMSWNYPSLLPPRKRSCGKVMFSQVSVSPQEEAGRYIIWDR